MVSGRVRIATAVANRNELLRHYDSVATDIRERSISTVFFARRIEHNFNRLEVIVEGDPDLIIFPNPTDGQNISFELAPFD